MTIPTVPAYSGQLPDESDPVTFSTRAEAVFDWLVTDAAPAISSVADEMNAALAGDPGTVVDAVGDIQDRLSLGYIPGQPQYLTSGSGSWEAPAGMKALEVQVIGAGGGGGGVNGNIGGGTDDAAGGGGGGGGYARRFFLPVGSPTYSYAVGTGGGSGTGETAGTDGGDTTFASSGALNLVGYGGNGGAGASGTNTGQWNGGLGGNATGGDLNVRGQNGGMGKVNAGNPVPTGDGGAPGSLFPGTPCRFMNQDGFSATSPGAGGAGAIANSVNDDFAGGAGGDGLIILIPYF